MTGGEEEARRGEGRVVEVRTPPFRSAPEVRALEVRLELTRLAEQSPPVLRRVGVGFRTLFELTTECPRLVCLLANCTSHVLLDQLEYV